MGLGLLLLEGQRQDKASWTCRELLGQHWSGIPPTLGVCWGQRYTDLETVG